MRGSAGRGGDVSLAAQRAVLRQNPKTLGSVCFHILMPKDVLGSEPQEVSSEQHSSLFPASREESLLCAVRVALLCSAFFSVLIMASEFFWGLWGVLHWHLTLSCPQSNESSCGVDSKSREVLEHTLPLSCPRILSWRQCL